MCCINTGVEIFTLGTYPVVSLYVNLLFSREKTVEWFFVSSIFSTLFSLFTRTIEKQIAHYLTCQKIM